MPAPSVSIAGSELTLGDSAKIALSAAMDGIAILDSQGRYVYLNDAHLRIYGYERPEELLGKSWEVLYSESELERFRQRIMPYFALSGNWRGEAKGTRRDGTKFIQEVSLSRLDDGGLVCIVRDVTEQRNDRDTLRLLNDVTAAAIRSRSQENIVFSCLRTICETKRWPVGIAWLPEKKPGNLGVKATFALDKQRWESVLKGHAGVALAAGQDLPGRVFKEQTAMHVFDLKAVQPMPKRLKTACASGLVAALAFPVVCDNEVLAVFEFLTPGHSIFNPGLTGALNRLGELLGVLFKRGESEEALKRSASVLSATFDSVTDGIVVTDNYGKVMLANMKARLLLKAPTEVSIGATPEQYQGHFKKLLVTTEMFWERVAEIYAAQEQDSFDILELLDGRTLERTSAPQRVDGRVVGRVWTFRDVSRERQIERERAELLRAEQLRLAQSQRAAQKSGFLAEASAVLDTTLDYESTVRTAARLPLPKLADWCAIDILEDELVFRRAAVAHSDPGFELSHHQLEGQYRLTHDLGMGSYHVMKTGQPELIEEVEQSMLSNLAQHELARAHLSRIGLYSYMCVPLKTRGRVLGAITLGWCHTKRKYNDADLTLAHDLSQRAAIAIDNARLYREAQEAIQTRQDFISTASHELRTPLTSLMGYLQLANRIMKKPNADSGEETARLIQGAEEQCRRIIQLLGELLDFSQISARGVRLHRETVDLAQVVRDAIERLSHAYDLSQSPITLDVDGKALGNWDRLRLDQVMTNLLTNAIKYGGGKPVQVRITQAPEMVTLYVQDRGIGISAEEQGRIFGRFERAATVRTYRGTGLGLWITRRIVEAHHGDIRVESSPGHGSTFIVELPRT